MTKSETNKLYTRLGYMAIIGGAVVLYPRPHDHSNMFWAVTGLSLLMVGCAFLVIFNDREFWRKHDENERRREAEHQVLLALIRDKSVEQALLDKIRNEQPQLWTEELQNKQDELTLFWSNVRDGVYDDGQLSAHVSRTHDRDPRGRDPRAIDCD